MKARIHISALTVFALVILGVCCESSEAFYHPGMGRFVNRDPAGQISPRVGAMAVRGSFSHRNGMFIPRDIAPPFGMIYVDGNNLYQYVNSQPTRLVDAMGLKAYDPGPNYPYTCPKKNPKCNRDDFMWKRWWAGFDTQLRFGEKPNGPKADGRGINGFAHCLAACRVHKDMPECDWNWEQSEWKKGKPKDFLSDLDIRNNNIGRDCASKKGSCWNCCFDKYMDGELWCDDGNGNAIMCPNRREGDWSTMPDIPTPGAQ